MKFILNNLPVLIVLLVLSSLFAANDCSHKTEEKRLKDNISALTSNVEHFKTKAGNEAARTFAMSLTIEELEYQNRNLTRDIKNLTIKISKTSSVSSTGVSTKNTIKTILYDTVEYIDTIPLRYKAFNYIDPWFSVKGKIVNDSISIETKHIDSIIVVSHYKRKWFLGRKHFTVTATSKNPNSKIDYLFHTEIKKRKRFLWIF